MGMFGTEYATTENKFVEFKQLQKQMDIKTLEENEKFNSDAQCLAQTNVTMDLQKYYFKLPTIALGNYKHCPLYEYSAHGLSRLARCAFTRAIFILVGKHVQAYARFNYQNSL